MNRAKRDIRAVIVITLIISAMLIFLIGLTAQCSKLQYEINSINRQIQESERAIQNLEVKIKSASNINNLEDRALALGLVYPDFDDIIYLDEASAGTIEDFASTLKETAYRN